MLDGAKEPSGPLALGVLEDFAGRTLLLDDPFIDEENPEPPGNPGLFTTTPERGTTTVTPTEQTRTVCRNRHPQPAHIRLGDMMWSVLHAPVGR